ncbi:hypothetical protein ACQEVY_18295 [Streptomyces sp. CA-288835]|uniref:hypothetical protein n=1 Tax=Streptomyces sp. CA-288835 TaxID=3240069 RepID=UPI003D8F4CA8
MDQEVAGIIAGIAGLVGAGVGGLATAYGARVGAQKTIEATHLQVERQSTAEHTHWIREHRRQVYGDVMASHAKFLATTVNRVIELREGRPQPSEDHQRFREHWLDLVETTARVDLWGPGDVQAQAQALRGAAGDVNVALAGWSDALREDRTGDVSNRAQDFEAASEAFAEAWAAFVSAAVQALQF